MWLPVDPSLGWARVFHEIFRLRLEPLSKSITDSLVVTISVESRPPAARMFPMAPV